jgi:hypothetical protein
VAAVLVGVTGAWFSGITATPPNAFSAGQLDPWVPSSVTVSRTASTTCLVSWTPQPSPPPGLTHDVVDGGGATLASGVSGTSTSVTVPAGAVSLKVAARLNAWVSATSTAAPGPCNGYPGAPTGLTLTPGDGTVAVSWTAPAANGGTLASYSVSASPGSTTCSASAPSTSCTLTGLTDGTYTVSVTATSDVGTGPAASAATSVSAVDHVAVSAPAGATAGSAFSVTVTAQDASNVTVTGYRGTVRFTSSDVAALALPADYSFTAADNGTHTFTNMVTLRTSGSRTVTATDTAQPTVSGTATVTVSAAAATSVVLSTQPGGGTGGLAWATQPVATVRDTYGNTVTSSSAAVTLAIGTNPAGGTLTCTTNPRTAVAGVATFAGCKIDSAGSGYTLTAAATGLTGATSTAFTVAVGPAAQLAFTQQPTSSTGGIVLPQQPVVTVRDAGGNTVTASSATVTVAKTSGTGSGSGVLVCTQNAVAASSGVATFAGCKINKSSNGYSITATATGITSAVSTTFNITVGPPAQVSFNVMPPTGTVNDVLAPSVTVEVQDAGGNKVSSATNAVTMSIGSNPGSATLSGTLTRTPSGGTATFADLSLNAAAGGYTLTATATGLTSDTSNTFTVNLYKLVFTQQPGDGTVGVALAVQPVVSVVNGAGTVITASSASITLVRTSGSGSGSVTCTTNPRAATSGVATFAGCKMSATGATLTLTASATGITPAVSNIFTIS